jgi:hypothetical protein
MRMSDHVARSDREPVGVMCRRLKVRSRRQSAHLSVRHPPPPPPPSSSSLSWHIVIETAPLTGVVDEHHEDHDGCRKITRVSSGDDDDDDDEDLIKGAR